MPDTPFASLVEESPLQLWTARPDGSLDYVNAAVTEFFGRTAEQMLGEGWLDSLHPADVAQTVERWTQALTTGTPYTMEFRLRRAEDRQYYWHLAQAKPRRDADGTIVGWVGANTDINGLKRMVEIADARQEIVRRERDRFLRAFHLSPAAVALYSGPNFVLEMVNAKWEETTGKSGVLGKPLREVFPDIAGQGLFEIMERVYQTGEPYHAAEMRILSDHDGVPRETYWNVVLQPLSEPGEPIRQLLGHSIDVTDTVLARRNESSHAVPRP
jgi:PAS domain S-box-containing protein